MTSENMLKEQQKAISHDIQMMEEQVRAGTQKVRTKLWKENWKLAERQSVANRKNDAELSTNVPDDNYFDQFNTSSR